MKKLYTLLVVALFSVQAVFAGATCTIDTTNTKFFSPATDSLPCIERTVFYQQVVQMHVADSLDVGPAFGLSPGLFIIQLDSIQLDSIKNLPTGINYAINPYTGHFNGGDNGCTFLYGNTTDTVGTYTLGLYGTVWVSGIPQGFGFPADTALSLQNLPGGLFTLAVDVINQGAPCRPAPVVVPCTIDSSNTAFFSPRPDSIPCVERTVPYSQVIQIKIPTSIDLQDFGSPISFVLTVDSVVITGVNGLPTGLTYESNPSGGVFYGGSYGCALLEGTTTDPADRYPITFNGTFTAHGQPFPPFFDGDTTIDFATLQSLGGGLFDLFLDVINQGDPCRPAPSGISDFSADLNSLIRVYPNPNNGLFNVRIDAGRRLKGDMVILDVTGRKVFTEAIDAVGLYTNSINLSQFAKGLYTLQVRTAEGNASKSISVE